jgi:predicted transcriptional regulator
VAVARTNGEGEPPARPATRLAVFDASIRRGLADAGEGRTNPAEDVFDRLERKYLGMVGPEK